jgi:uncharacterized protein YbbK (DUF523 family)
VREDRPRVGISACLLGERVRFDGGHKRDPFLVETLGPAVEWVPVCPEVEAGFGTPREPMRLVRVERQRPDTKAYAEGRVAMVVHATGEDVTSAMHDYARRKVEELANASLSGFVLKKDSPSCGVERVKVYGRVRTVGNDGDGNGGETSVRVQANDGEGNAGLPQEFGRGVFAAALMERMPELPVEDEGRLSDACVREHFIEQVFTYQKSQGLLGLRRRFTTGRR